MSESLRAESPKQVDAFCSLRSNVLRVIPNWSKWIAWVATTLMIIFGIIGHGPSTYRYAILFVCHSSSLYIYAILFLGPMLWGLYFARFRLHIEPWQFAIFAAAILLHDLG